MTFQIDAAILHEKQSCLRKANLGHEWNYRLWRAKSLFDVLLRRGILQLSKGIAVAQAAGEAKATFLEKATEPGLDLIGKDPWEASKGWTSLLESVLHGLAKSPLPVLHDPHPAKLTASMEWRFLSWADDSGQLHRWVTVDALDRDALAREMHSWRTVGDLCLSRTPMVLHVIVIGQQRQVGHFASAWTRTWRHPAMPNLRWQFLKPEDSTTWKPLYLCDIPDISAEEWVEMAWGQGALQPLMQDFLVEEPSEETRMETLRQITLEAVDTKKAIEAHWHELPMSRGVCDLFVPCVYQPVCHSQELVDIESTGLYVRKKPITVSVKQGSAQ
jgi:hypothetical protein